MIKHQKHQDTKEMVPNDIGFHLETIRKLAPTTKVIQKLTCQTHSFIIIRSV
jgi:hypothetical protein